MGQTWMEMDLNHQPFGLEATCSTSWATLFFCCCKYLEWPTSSRPASSQVQHDMSWKWVMTRVNEVLPEATDTSLTSWVAGEERRSDRIGTGCWGGPELADEFLPTWILLLLLLPLLLLFLLLPLSFLHHLLLFVLLPIYSFALPHPPFPPPLSPLH